MFNTNGARPTTCAAVRRLYDAEDTMSGSLEKAFGYQGNNMNLPVPDLEAALPFYETVLGFRVILRSATPNKSAVLARTKSRWHLRKTAAIPARMAAHFM
jgi:hypothetical protein